MFRLVKNKVLRSWWRFLNFLGFGWMDIAASGDYKYQQSRLTGKYRTKRIVSFRSARGIK